jgi:hypothetical protein
VVETAVWPPCFARGFAQQNLAFFVPAPERISDFRLAPGSFMKSSFHYLNIFAGIGSARHLRPHRVSHS